MNMGIESGDDNIDEEFLNEELFALREILLIYLFVIVTKLKNYDDFSAVRHHACVSSNRNNV